MKNSLRVFVLLTLSCAVLTVFASADMGPKPQLTVRVEHAPEELHIPVAALDVVSDYLLNLVVVVSCPAHCPLPQYICMYIHVICL